MFHILVMDFIESCLREPRRTPTTTESCMVTIRPRGGLDLCRMMAQ